MEAIATTAAITPTVPALPLTPLSPATPLAEPISAEEAEEIDYAALAAYVLTQLSPILEPRLRVDLSPNDDGYSDLVEATLNADGSVSIDVEADNRHLGEVGANLLEGIKNGFEASTYGNRSYVKSGAKWLAGHLELP